ncbi:MAG: sulfite exporter TauE/SafE family protein [bacterium]|nr:sulfite exporter TauE/SafE family protein [bacterium]
MQTKEHLYFVRGTHCASCEIVIEKTLIELKNIRSVEAKSDKGEVLIEYEGSKPTIEELNKMFKESGYTFFDKPEEKEGIKEGDGENNNLSSIVIISLAVLAGWWFLNKLGVSNFINVGAKSSLPAFFLFGLLAGFSSCAALVGGIVLSLSKQWEGLYAKKNSTKEKLQPHFMFNIGRVLGFTLLGAILGIVGSKLQFTLGFAPFLVIAVSMMMIFLALQMLGVKAFRKFQLTMPRAVTRYVANEKNFQGKTMPLFMGVLTFFLPCGFTITAQGLALLSGNPVQAALIMGLFALGTAPALLGIGFSAVKFSNKPHTSLQFARIAGVVVLSFALFNINSQLTVLGYSGFSGMLNSLTNNNSGGTQNKEGLAAIVNGKQLLKMDAGSSGYKPNYFKVKVGVPVRWEITDIGTSGCTNAVISKSLFSGQISLTPGQTSVKEFIPEKPGKYRFSCWMGMVSGTIEVISDKVTGSTGILNTAQANDSSLDIIPSGAQICGGGGEGAGGCGCGGGQ